MALNSGAQVWSPFRELNEIVENAIVRKQPDSAHNLGVALRRHKPDFISLLQNPAKSTHHRELLKKASSVGLPMGDDQTTQTFSQQFIDEALILSDLLDLNELAAVELLMAGENQQPDFPGLTRGLVAVLLYYDGRRSIVNSLRALIQSREGRTWTLGLSSEIVSMTTSFTDQLVEEGLVDKILDLITNMDLAQELDKLQKDRALGPPKHRKQVTDLFKEIKCSLAECLYCLACQQPLSRGDTLRLMAFLKTDNSVSADGTLEPVSVCLLMTMLYCLDISILDQEDAGDLIQALPIISDNDYLPEIHREMKSSQSWACPGLKATVQFAWSLALRQLSQYQGLTVCVGEFCEEDEAIMDVALADNTFLFLKECVVAFPDFHKEEFYLRRVHGLITDFIFHMPLKWKELRNRGDETARLLQAHQLEGVEPSANLRRDFEHLLELISDLYSKDPMGLELVTDYWCPPEPFGASTMFGNMTTAIGHRPPQKQVSLYKFVRIAGDLLPPYLYIPYIHMLTGLAHGQQCAYHLFHLLKLNGTSQGGSASLVSWDHIFFSLNQYYTNLRKETPTSSDSAAQRYRHYHRGITPQELEGLLSVLRLTRTVAEESENARLGLCENQQWVPVVLLFGLVGCCIPPELKAELLLTLAAFGRTPDIAANLWQSLEVSQIVGTIQPGSQPGGLQVELAEIESRNETYPLTQAFLEFINVLTEIPIPAALGAGYRVPGFEPYLLFIRDDVLLKFASRAYKNASEKWSVAAGALEILCKLMESHEVCLEDFLDQQVETPGGKSVGYKPPGHTLLLHMLNETGLLKMVLYILDEAIKQFETYTSIPGKLKLERASLLCLRMIQVTMEKENVMMYTQRESGASTFISSMDKLLMAINPRSGKPDHLVNIAKYVIFGTFLPEHALAAVKILRLVSRWAVIQSDLVGLFTADEMTSKELLHGFVECLEADEAETKPSADQLEEGSEDLNTAQVKNACRQQLLQLILYSVDQPAPNIAHFLLGLELQKPVSKTNLQEPGVLGSPKTCLHAILTLLDRGIGTLSGPTCLYDTPVLAGLGYQLIYKLCANKDTAAPAMRYLRTTRDFLYKHLQLLPFQQQTITERKFSAHQTWLLKAVAIELRLTSLNRQRSNTQRLMTLLLDDYTDEQAQGLLSEPGEADFSTVDQGQSILNTSTVKTQPVRGHQKRKKILRILDSIDLTQKYPDQLQLEFFDPRLIEEVITKCEQESEQGVSYYDIKALHRILMNEINNLQGTTMAGQRSLVMEEVQAILRTSLARNMVRENLHEKRQAFEAWRQVVEILLTSCPEDLLTGEARQNVLFELLQDLLKKVSDEDTLPELTAPVAGVILTLMTNLRQCFVNDQSEGGESLPLTQYVSFLDGAGAGPQPVGFPTSSSSRTLFSTSLQVVLKGIIEYILRSSGRQQRVRANLYGALLYFLQIAQKPPELPHFLTGPGDSSRVESVILSKESEYEQLAKENLNSVMSFGENFMDIVCRDACDGHDVGRMLALSVLDALVGLDKYQQWLNFLSGKGYLQHLIDSLLNDDEPLQALLTNNLDSLRVLYIYESKMGLFTKIGESVSGAHSLLRSGIVQRLAECRFFDMRPELERHGSDDPDTGDDDFIPSPMARYRQLLSSALKLCLAILTSLGIENKDSGSQVLQFVVAHIDVFNVIIREKLNTMNLPSLRELSLLTAVLGRAAYHGDIENEYFQSEAAALEYKGHVARIQRQMLALLPKYCLSERMIKQLEGVRTRGQRQEEEDKKTEIMLCVQEITANVMSFCRSLISSSGNSAKYCRILFGPSLEEALARDLRTFEDYQSSTLSPIQTPNLGLVVFHLRRCTNQFMSVYDNHQEHLRKLQSLADLTNEDLKHFLDAGTSEKLSTQQRQQIARKRLIQIVGHKVKELRHYSYIIENCLFVLWRHLEFYLLHCVPMDKQPSLYQVHVKRNRQLRRLQDISSLSSQSMREADVDPELEEGTRGVTQEDIDQLKMEAVSAINETLFEKLQKIDQCFGKSRTEYGFTEALIRRIKRLLKLHTGLS
ncbi:nuclear pore complex protein Nup205-like [Liolophura sinensis]|uniref:nuclear pore complex protein Nup205-like n=1 Tax=Liolophura sinensis TaxID=3198878 RepID=UPI0031593847